MNISDEKGVDEKAECRRKFVRDEEAMKLRDGIRQLMQMDVEISEQNDRNWDKKKQHQVLKSSVHGKWPSSWQMTTDDKARWHRPQRSRGFFFTTWLGENNYLEAALEKQTPPPRDPIEWATWAYCRGGCVLTDQQISVKVRRKWKHSEKLFENNLGVANSVAFRE